MRKVGGGVNPKKDNVGSETEGMRFMTGSNGYFGSQEGMA